MKYKWQIEIQVDKTWVEDGFNLSDPRCLENLLNSVLPYAYGHERKAKVTKEPNMARVAKVQGYSTIEEMKQDYRDF